MSNAKNNASKVSNIIIAVVNQKGGVGKTTSVVNLASALVNLRKKILVVDLDPQSNATTASGVEKTKLDRSIYDVLIEKNTALEVCLTGCSGGYDILPANRDLAGAEVELVSLIGREFRLKESLVDIAMHYDIVLLDCPPSLSILTLNGLACATHVVVPVQCEYYALEGLTDLLNTIGKLKQRINPELNLLGLLRTMFDGRNNLANQVTNELTKHFGDKVFKTHIPRNVRLAEAPSFGMSLVKLDKTASGALAYLALAKELVKRLNF